MKGDSKDLCLVVTWPYIYIYKKITKKTIDGVSNALTEEIGIRDLRLFRNSGEKQLRAQTNAIRE